ncbi:MAG: RHS repeat protein, partial [Comamonadaceae bacterium]
NGRVQQVRGSEGRRIDLTYGVNGFVSKLVDHTGRTQSYEYTTSVQSAVPAVVSTMPPRVSKITDAAGRDTEYVYTSVPRYTNIFGGTAITACESDLPQDHINIASIKYPESDTPTQNTYGTDRILKQTTATGETWGFSYRRIGACVVKVNPTPSAEFAYLYTCRAGQSLSTRTCASSGGAGTCTEQVIGTCPDVDSEESYAAGWRFYGGTNVETRVTRPDGTHTTTRFNPKGMPLEVVDQNGQLTRYAYNARQQPVLVTDPLGRQTRYEYDDRGNRTAVTNALGHRVETTYDQQFNKPTGVTQFLLGVPSTQNGQQLSYTPVARTFLYDGKGQPTMATDPVGIATTMAYNARGRLSEVVLPARTDATHVPVVTDAVASALPKSARKISMAYSNAGDLTMATDPLGNETKYTPDSLGRIGVSTDALGYSTQMTYNSLGQLTEVDNPLGERSSLQYDAQARLTAVINPARVAIESYG